MERHGVILPYTYSVFIHLTQTGLRPGSPLFCCQGEPFDCLGRVSWCTIAGEVHPAQADLGRNKTLISGSAVQFQCLERLPGYTQPPGIHKSKIEPGLGKALIRRKCKPANSLRVIFSGFVDQAQIEAGPGIVLLCRSTVPAHRCSMVLRNTTPRIVEVTQPQLAPGKPLFSGLPEPFCSLEIILRETITAFQVEHSHVEPGLGKPQLRRLCDPVHCPWCIAVPVIMVVLVKVTERITGPGILLCSRLHEPLYGSFTVLSRTLSLVKHKANVVLGPAVTLFSQLLPCVQRPVIVSTHECGFAVIPAPACLPQTCEQAAPDDN